MDDELSIVYGPLWVWRSVLDLRELELQMCVCSYIMRRFYRLCICTRMDVFFGVCVLACTYVCLIALVTQAVSHSHCSKPWVGEGHCEADRRDRKERGDGGWVGEKATEKDDNEKLKAVRKWDVGLHSSTILQKSMSLPGDFFSFCLFETRASQFSVENRGLLVLFRWETSVS